MHNVVGDETPTSNQIYSHYLWILLRCSFILSAQFYGNWLKQFWAIDLHTTENKRNNNNDTKICSKFYSFNLHPRSVPSMSNFFFWSNQHQDTGEKEKTNTSQNETKRNEIKLTNYRSFHVVTQLTWIFHCVGLLKVVVGSIYTISQLHDFVGEFTVC